MPKKSKNFNSEVNVKSEKFGMEDSVVDGLTNEQKLTKEHRKILIEGL